MIKVEDFGLVGPSYTAPMLLQGTEECINWYVEIADIGSVKMPLALLGTPGLNPVLNNAELPEMNAAGQPLQEPLSGPVRGLHVLPGGVQALMVVGNGVYIVNASKFVGQEISLAAKKVGELTTNEGPVSISDNGVAVGQMPLNDNMTGPAHVGGGGGRGPDLGTSGNDNEEIIEAYLVALQIATQGAVTSAKVVSEFGKGGYAVIVDGMHMYYYLLSGVPTIIDFSINNVAGESVTFTEGPQLADGSYQGTITFPTGGSIPDGLVVAQSGSEAQNVFIAFAEGSSPGDIASRFPPGTTFYVDPTGQQLTIDFNNLTLLVQTPTEVANFDSSEAFIGILINPFGIVTDPAAVEFGPSNRVDFFEGWFIFNQIGSRLWFTNAPVPYTLTFSGLFYALADNGSDNLITLMVNQGELFLFTEYRIECWVNSGGTNFAWTRLEGVSPQLGCSAPFSLARLGTQLVWLERNEQGENTVYQQTGYTGVRISTHAMEHEISKYPEVSDAVAYTYDDEGHLFYVITFPSADVTWVYDDTSTEKFGYPCWHKRLSSDENGQYHRHRSNCFMNILNTRIVGDYQSGQLHHMNRDFLTDAGMPIRSLRRTRHIWAPSSRARVYLPQMQLEFTPGVGTTQGQGFNPKAMLRWSSDGGFSWSREYWAPIGKTGETRNRCMFRQLGYAHDRVFEVSFSDPVPRDLIGCTLYGEPEVPAIGMG